MNDSKYAKAYALHERLLDGESLTDDEIVAMLVNSELGWSREHRPELFEKFKAEILPLIAQGGGFSFGGDNCETDDGCSWDGVSRRCDCGNRRVEWVHDMGSWRGEAY